ncbi:unnamed protein product [Trichogramma brassicae]|uniref:Uncharacterized protein n=1 Tax=Trichogramma brassicae TaxID=86971 RepID=A0A6H5I4E0_9HYME|nr:unnamed protein product [Trichogramma brassicae]
MNSRAAVLVALTKTRSLLLDVQEAKCQWNSRSADKGADVFTNRYFNYKNPLSRVVALPNLRIATLEDVNRTVVSIIIKGISCQNYALNATSRSVRAISSETTIKMYMSSCSQWNDDIQDHQLIVVYDSRLPLCTTSIQPNFHNHLSCIRVHPIVYSRRTEWKQSWSTMFSRRLSPSLMAAPFAPFVRLCMAAFRYIKKTAWDFSIKSKESCKAEDVNGSNQRCAAAAALLRNTSAYGAPSPLGLQPLHTHTSSGGHWTPATLRTGNRSLQRNRFPINDFSASAKHRLPRVQRAAIQRRARCNYRWKGQCCPLCARISFFANETTEYEQHSEPPSTRQLRGIFAIRLQQQLGSIAPSSSRRAFKQLSQREPDFNESIFNGGALEMNENCVIYAARASRACDRRRYVRACSLTVIASVPFRALDARVTRESLSCAAARLDIAMGV